MAETRGRSQNDEATSVQELSNWVQSNVIPGSWWLWEGRASSVVFCCGGYNLDSLSSQEYRIKTASVYSVAGDPDWQQHMPEWSGHRIQSREFKRLVDAGEIVKLPTGHSLTQRYR